MAPDSPTDDGASLPDDAPSLATLFCPECGHRSRYDGDWVLSTTANVTRYSCPDCGTKIQSRPSDGRGDVTVGRRNPPVLPP